MIAFRYKLKSMPMKIAEKSFTAEGVEFPAGSFVIEGPVAAEVRAAVDELGLTAAALSTLPAVPMHDADAPRIAIYSQWTGTQDLGWYRLTFDNFGIPVRPDLQGAGRRGTCATSTTSSSWRRRTSTARSVLQAPSTQPQPYQKSDKYKFLGMYGETADMSGGFGQEGVDCVCEVPRESGGTLIAAGAAVRFPIEFGWAHTVDIEQMTGVTAQTADRPGGDCAAPMHPVFYGYTDKVIPMKYVGGSVLRVGVADQNNILARYVGGDSSVLSGAMVGADQLRQRAFAVDIPGAYNGKGPRDSVRQQSDLPVAEPRRVQHDLQLDPELERQVDSRRFVPGRVP